jgi:hypothetical protein
MDTSKNSNWTIKDGWEYFKKMITRPDKSLTIQNELIKLNSKLTLEHGFVIADMNRQSQIMTGFEDGSISIDFWENGICWHSQFLKDLETVTLVAYLWNDLRENSDAIEKQVSLIHFPEKRKQIEISNQQYIKWHWDNLVYGDNNLENELIGLLKESSTITRLMTFHQLWDFGLSRYIGNYGNNLKNDLLRAKVQDNIIEVRTEEMASNDYGKGEKSSIGKGNAKTAYKLIVDNLPSDLGWAEYQTVEQFIARTQKSGS